MPPSQRETLPVFLKQFCLHGAGRALQRNESLTLGFQAGGTCWRRYFVCTITLAFCKPGLCPWPSRTYSLWGSQLASGCFKAHGLPLEEWQRPQWAGLLLVSFDLC